MKSRKTIVRRYSMNDFILLVLVPLIFCVLIGGGLGIISRERNARKRVEQELQSTRKSLKDLCEACIKENNSTYARITYQAYFRHPVDHTGDGFIDGYE